MYKNLKIYQRNNNSYESKSAFPNNEVDIPEFKQMQQGGYDWNNPADLEELQVFLNNNHKTDTIEQVVELNRHMDAAQRWFAANLNKTNERITNINLTIQTAMLNIDQILRKFEQIKKTEIKTTSPSSDVENKARQAIVLSKCHTLLIALNEFVKEHHVKDVEVFDKLRELNQMIKKIINVIPTDE